MSSNIIYINTAHPDFVVRAGGNASIMVWNTQPIVLKLAT
jgi:hypothetical protein